MAQNWKAPGADKTRVTYSVQQLASGGEWVIERTESKFIAWFPDRHSAAEVARALLPADAERKL